MKTNRLLVSLFMLLLAVSAVAQVTVGSKKFTESYVLGEVAKRLLNEAGVKAEHKQGLGATSIVWEALTSGDIDCYPEYTGTISEEILKSKEKLAPEAMQAELGKHGIGMTGELGFNNTYALVMRKKQASELGIKSIADLAGHPELRVKVSHEFLERKDGWKPLSERYGLAMQDVQGIDHGIAYEALAGDKIDVTDAYSTDAKIGTLDLYTLLDDRSFFPAYKAVFLYKLDMPEKGIEALTTLEGKIDEAFMIKLNGEAEKTQDFALAASSFFGEQARRQAQEEKPSVALEVAKRIGEHLYLVGWAMLFAVLIGIPLGVLASTSKALGQAILGVTGVIQTIPSLALLALMVPLFGIEARTAITALLLYSLLPIVRNTATGLADIPASIKESAAAIGLEPGAAMVKVLLPMASRSILAGIKVSAVICVGTAALAALIGQGGLGEPMIAGLAVNGTELILRGAIPAAVLAIVVQIAFDVLDRVVIPKGLRL